MRFGEAAEQPWPGRAALCVLSWEYGERDSRSDLASAGKHPFLQRERPWKQKGERQMMKSKGSNMVSHHGRGKWMGEVRAYGNPKEERNRSA